MAKPLNREEIKIMEKACQLAAKTLYYVGKYVKPGVTTNELDRIAHEYTLSNNALPAPLGYHGYPKSICTSVNECICHGVPDDKVLNQGDIINIDITSIVDGFFGDTSAMFYVGDVSDEAMQICDVAKVAMQKGIEAISPNGKTGDIGFATNKYLTKKGYTGVREIGGHGIGQSFHTDPFVPCFGKKGKGELIRPWTCLTVEPMINQTDVGIIEFGIPGSSVKYYETGDKSLSAQYEHTILITDESYEILTAY